VRSRRATIVAGAIAIPCALAIVIAGAISIHQQHAALPFDLLGAGGLIAGAAIAALLTFALRFVLGLFPALRA
jgi:hypothetical protein